MLKVWHFNSTGPVCTFEGHDKGVNTVDYLQGENGEQLLISGGDDRYVKVWSLEVRVLFNYRYTGMSLT